MTCKELKKQTENKKRRQLTSGFTQAGAQLVRHFVSNSCFRLSSEPLQSPRLREAATTLEAMRGHASGHDKIRLKVLYNLTI